MVQGRYNGPWPNYAPPNGQNMREQPPNYQRATPGPNPFFQQMPQQPSMNPQPRANGPFNQQQPQGGAQSPPKKEGFLGKLLGRSKQNTASQNRFSPPSSSQKKTETRSGGFIETLTKPEGLTNMLNNTQKVLQAAEQFTPMVQQYGPIMKNLPSMWKVMRALGSSSVEAKVDTPKEASLPLESTAKVDQQKPASLDSDQDRQRPKQTKRKKKQQSVPKLYI